MLVDFFGRAPRYHLDGSPLLQRLADSDTEFHLTGSRYRGTPRPDSDFDFFVQDDAYGNAVMNALAGLGFEMMFARHDPEGYDDDKNFTTAVLECTDVGVPATGVRVQVQLVRSVAAAKKVRDIVELHFREHDEDLAAAKDKAARRLFWRAVQRLVVSTMPETEARPIPNTEPVAVAAVMEDDDDDLLPF